MATEAQVALKISLEAGADLHTVQYLFVKRDTNGRAIVCTSASDTPIGVLQNKPTALGQMAEIVVIGITKVLTTTSGTAFSTFNDGVAPYSDGSAQKATATGFSSSYVQGTKSCVGKIAPIGGTNGPGIPAAADITRVVIDCASSPTPAT